MITEAVQWACGVMAVPIAVGYVCRIGIIYLREHQTAICLMHASLLGGTLYSFTNAIQTQATGGDLLYLTGAAAWLVASMPRWGAGVPAHFSRTVKG